MAGDLRGPTDVDPGPGVDMRSPQGPADTFVMKFNADWSYAWTITFGGPSSISTPLGLSVSSTAIVVTGLYQVAIDLDPGPGTLIKTTFSPGGYATYVVATIASYTPAGVLRFLDAFDGSGASSGSNGLAVGAAADGSIYVSLRAFALRPGGGVIVAGAIPVPGGMGGISSILLTRLDSDSTPAWSEALPVGRKLVPALRLVSGDRPWRRRTHEQPRALRTAHDRATGAFALRTSTATPPTATPSDPSVHEL